MNKITYGNNEIILNLKSKYIVVDIYFIGNYFVDIDCPQNHFAGLSHSYDRCIVLNLKKNSILDNFIIGNYKGNLKITKAFYYDSDSKKKKIEIENLDVVRKYNNLETTFNSSEIIFNQKQKSIKYYRKKSGKVSNLSSELIVEKEVKKYRGSPSSLKNVIAKTNKTKKVSRENEKQNIKTSNIY